MMILANLTWPLFVIGVLLVLLAVVLFKVHHRSDVLSDAWVAGMKRQKQAMTMGVVGILMTIGSFAVDGIDEPYTKTVVKTVYKTKNVPPSFERLLNRCYEETEISSYSKSDKIELVDTCTNNAVVQYAAITKGPIRTREVVKFKKLPYQEFMKQCVITGRSNDPETIKVLAESREQCTKLATTRLLGLVSAQK